MFNNKKKPQPGIEQTKLATLIAQDIVITGNLEYADGLRLDGRVHGNVAGKPGAKTLLVLSERGAIEGNVHGYDIVVNGRIQGDVIADQGRVKRRVDKFPGKSWTCNDLFGLFLRVMASLLPLCYHLDRFP